jgi:nitrite reductase/ring-hydroxylating ferredoxin subunit/DMSO/TMAO reductase YedYZ heme-binding membrane subunit
MSVGYSAVSWSRHKVVYDVCVACGVLVFVACFVAVGKLTWRGAEALSDEVLLIRATGSAAFALLHAVLMIGPLARLVPRLAPVLSNRRHLGVTTFFLGLTHGTLTIGYYHGFGVIDPLRSLLMSLGEVRSVAGFSFELLGIAALAVLFLLAATSHDFWLKLLSARVWKWLHMSVYGAYVLLVGHVALGALQGRAAWPAWWMVVAGLAALTGLHLVAGVREWRRDTASTGGEWIDVGPADEISMNRARVVCAARGERIAVFRHGDGISAVTNVCAHQGGPLGEGKVIDGFVTCPWHGWQYRPEDGCAPPPFVEKISTYQVRIKAGRCEVLSRANEPGTVVPPVEVQG